MIKIVRSLFGMALAVLLPINAALALDLGVYGTYWAPDDGDDTWGFGAKAGVPLITEHFQLEGRAFWYPETSQGRIGDVEFVPLDLGVALHLFPRGEVDVFAMGGGSYIYADGSDVSVDDTWGAYVGGGLEFALNSNLAVAGEVLVRLAEFDLESNYREDQLDATGVNVNLGLRLRF